MIRWSNYETQISLQIRWGLISLGIKTFHHRAVISVISFMNAPTSDNIAINAARWQKLKSEWKFASYLCNKRKWKENRIFSCEKIRNCLPLTLVPTAPHIITIKFANKRLRPGRPAAIKSDSDIGGRSLIFVLWRGLQRGVYISRFKKIMPLTGIFIDSIEKHSYFWNRNIQIIGCFHWFGTE